MAGRKSQGKDSGRQNDFDNGCACFHLMTSFHFSRGVVVFPSLHTWVADSFRAKRLDNGEIVAIWQAAHKRISEG
jgi:hypothetical protein